MNKIYPKSIVGLAIAALSTTTIANAAISDVSEIMNAPSSNWEEIGEGFYHDELMISWGQPAADWKVTIEQNTKSTGWYRFIPYNENSTVYEYMGYADDQYMYINATNPKKVYAEDFTAYGIWYFSNVVVENDWDEAEQYGNLVDGVISWPSVNVWASKNNGYFYCAGETGVALYLPGSDYKDYSMDLVTEHFCTDDNTHDLLLIAGDHVDSFKYSTFAGNINGESNMNLVLQVGESVKVADGGAFVTLDLNDRAPGMYTTIIVAVDDKGNGQTVKQTNFIVPDNDMKWKELGETKFNEPLYYGVYDDFRNEELSCTIYESTTIPGLYLLDNPYASHSELAYELTDAHIHRHGIIVDATDPERVFVAPSAIGVSVDGDGAAWSLADYFVQSGVDADEVAERGFFGTKTSNEDGTYTVEMPNGTLMVGEKNYYYGEFIDCDSDFSFIVPASNPGAVDKIISDNCEYTTYNLQGIPVPADTKGTIIVKKGSTIYKKINR